MSNQILFRLSIEVTRKRFLHQNKVCFSKPIVRCQHNGSTATVTGQRFTIPQPTWSISSLQLHESHAPADMKELQLLAKRSVIDIRQFNDETKQQLCQDLGNMLHMMKQVHQFQATMTSDDDYVNDPIMLYDVPRGVREAPFRIDANTTTTSSPPSSSAASTSMTTATKADLVEQQISQSVRKSYLEPKMTRVGGHQYYEIITSIQRTNNKNQEN